MKYCVIDISSSSISLIAAETDGTRLQTVFSDRVNLAMLHYMEGKDLSARGIDKLAAAVSDMKEKCRNLSADRVYLISTAALRAVENSGRVSEAILERTGLPINPVSGETEAYCDFAANREFGTESGTALVDIGGGSIEICDLAGEDLSKRVFLDFGIFRLHEKFVEKIQPSVKEADKIQKYLKKKFDKAEIPGKGSFDSVIAVGANCGALYELYGAFYKEDKSEERVMTYKKFKKLADHLIEGRDRSRLILESAPEKLYSAGIAAVVAKTLFKRFGAKEIRISSRGVKEGYLQLILENRLQGSYYDFARQSYVLCEEERGTSADGAQGSRRKRAAKSMKPADKKSETAQKKTVGAGKKTASKKVALKQKKATENSKEDMKTDTQE